MSSSLILLLLLSLSVHACNARHLRGARKDSTKVVEKVKLVKSATPANLQTQSLSGELQSQSKKPENVKGVKDESVPGASTGASTGKTKGSMALPKDIGGTRGFDSGSENVASSSQVDLQQTSNLEEPGKRARRVLGTGSIVIHIAAATATTKERIGSKETDVVEDADAMDYVQPHRKPPIHNESP